MAAAPSPSTEGVRAALVYQAVALNEALQSALAGAGVQVVVETRADALDRNALNSAAPQVFVVNLDPDLEDHLDELTEVLDGFGRPVIFNDATASSGLSGWDQSRWARHLAAKIKGEVDAHPPRPEGAAFIPQPERKIVQIAAPRNTTPAVEPAAPSRPSAPATAVPPAAAVPAQAKAPVVVPAPALAPAPTAAPIAAPAPTTAAPAALDIDQLFADFAPAPAPAAAVVDRSQAPTRELPVLVAPATPATTAPATTPADTELAAVEFDFDVSESTGSATSDGFASDFFESTPATPALGTLQADFDTLWQDSTDSAELPEVQSVGSFAGFDQGFDDEAPLAGEALADFELPEPPARPAAAELTDLDDLFRQLEPATPAPVATPGTAPTASTAPATAPAPAAAPRKVAELKPPPMEWSLEPLDDDAPPPPAPTGRAEFKLGQDITQPVPPPPAPTPVAAAPVAESDTELADFDFFFEPGSAPAPSDASVNAVAEKPRAPLDLSEIPDFGLALEPLSEAESSESTPAPVVPAKPVPAPAASVVKPVASAPVAAPRPVAPVAPAKAPAAPAPASAPVDASASTDFDFAFDNFDAPAASAALGQRAMEAAALADLDGLFADIEAPPVISDIPNLDRVWILGASIGGPEAVRSFLTGLRKQVASAFILAQHMGSEFLDLMISQLAKASPLPVKVAQSGDRLQNGSVLVAPVGKRLTVDAQGRIVLSELSGDMPYSPSIDQIMFDMADRFGPRCSAVIFSGMAADAIEGAKYIASKGGRIWVQDPATCVISSMIDGAQAAGVVSYMGSPEQLADHLQAHLT